MNIKKELKFLPYLNIHGGGEWRNVLIVDDLSDGGEAASQVGDHVEGVERRDHLGHQVEGVESRWELVVEENPASVGQLPLFILGGGGGCGARQQGQKHTSDASRHRELQLDVKTTAHLMQAAKTSVLNGN